VNGGLADPRIALVYDAECVWGPDDDFFLSLVNARPSSRVLDLGCGTGRLTLRFAADGHAVTGVDPDPTALDRARGKPDAGNVAWIEGTSACLPADAFDTVVMTSHVAQFIVTDAQWEATLADLHRALVPGGTLAFDSRDPSDRAWERWTADRSRGEVVLADGSVVEVWTDVTEVADECVSFVSYNRFAGGETIAIPATARFRREDTLRSTLAEAGFGRVEIFGGWFEEPVGPGTGEFIVKALTLGR
jgi:SAM-dependent methyltransferase